MSLIPTIGGSGWLAEKKTYTRKKIAKPWHVEKSLWGKNPVKSLPACKKPGRAGKDSSWFVTCSTYMMVCMKHKLKFLWRGRLMSLLCSVCDMYNLLSLYCSPKSGWWLPSAWTLIVQSYEICDSPRITVIQTLFSGMITYIHYANAFTNRVTITLWEGVVRLVQCCLWSPISCVCVQEQGCWTSAPFFVTASLH